jgi:alpha-galactosidase
MPLQFNSWSPLGRNPKVSDIKKYVDFAAEFGFEVFATDASWFVRKDGNAIYGDWEPDPTGFPNGLKELSDYVHAKGMKFGVWLEPESVSTESRVAREHPGWILKYNGVPMQGTRTRVPLNFGIGDVGPWARAVVDRLVRQDKIDWLKLDYNADVGEAFDPPGTGRTGTVLYDHLKNYQAWLQQIRKNYPNLILENCSSGGLRSDLAMLAHTHLSFVSDVQEARSSVQLAYGCTLEFAPETCFQWMRGDEKDSSVNLKNPPGWWDFLFRTHMNGPFGITSRVLEWSPELRARAADNLALYKRVRSIIPGSDVYHLTPPPASGEDPTGWMALQYASPDRRRSLVMAYRLGKSDTRANFRLRGLNPEYRYSVTEDGRPRGMMSGAQLASAGLALQLDAEWRSAIVELAAN